MFSFRLAIVFCLAAAVACSNGGAVLPNDIAQDAGTAPTAPPRDTIVLSAPAIDATDVQIDRSTPTADELIEKDAKALDEKHATEPAVNDEEPQSRLWFHHVIGLVQV